ncbi:Uncharacterised protein [Acinetobacter baumannii]|uniref:hypothetical protein n=1 Tax=Acinetobacter baumannii TaxID=470 RepID=UPI000819A01D|nr:hypothetical protein [Acinetobacter baumannii]SCD14951.1 Uncharacterised protein [Acinetobacter baumannii]
MKPEQFIREYGVEKAREVVDGAPDKTATHYVFRKIPSYYSVEFQSWYHDDEWWDSDCHTEQDLIDSYGSDFVLSLSDLKRLVDSVDLVNNCGGLAIANKITFQKRLRNEKATHFIQHPENQKLIQLLGRNQRKPKEAIKFDLFEQAIRDHESIYGGGESHAN